MPEISKTAKGSKAALATCSPPLGRSSCGKLAWEGRAMPKRLAILVVGLLAAGCSKPEAPPPESGAADPPAQLPPDPFGPVPRHPPEVVRLMNLFPGIPAGGTFNDTVAYLGLSTKDWKEEAGGSEEVCASWPISPGY